MIAIGSMVSDRERLLARIAQEAPSADEDEQLSELVLDIDKGLGEMADAYEEQRQNAVGYPPFTELVATILASADEKQ